MAWRLAVLLMAAFGASGEGAVEAHGGGAVEAHGGTPHGAEGAARVLQQDAELTAHGYRYAYETENGIRAQETGSGEAGTQAAGSYSYVGPDGQTYSITYTADENGYRPQGAHLPTPPPIPDAILKALEQNARDEATGVSDDGSYHRAQQHASNSQYDYSQGPQVQYSQPAQYDRAAQYNQAEQYNRVAQYNQAGQYNQFAQHNTAVQYNRNDQYSRTAQYSQDAQNEAPQYSQVGLYNEAPEHSRTAQSEGSNQY